MASQTGDVPPDSRQAKASDVVEELRRELQLRPLHSNVRVAVLVAGQPSYFLRCGQLLKCSSGWPTAEGDGEVQDDVCIAFANHDAMAEVVLRVREALSSSDLAHAISSLLCQLAVPSWAGGFRGVQVSGTAALARLLWHMCFCQEKEAKAEPDGHDWANDDLGRGWVFVHSISPNIQERVAMFQRDLDDAAKTRSSGSATTMVGTDASASHAEWIDELITDLCRAAEQFKGPGLPAASCSGQAEVDKDDPAIILPGEGSPVALSCCKDGDQGETHDPPSVVAVAAATTATPQRQRAAVQVCHSTEDIALSKRKLGVATEAEYAASSSHTDPVPRPAPTSLRNFI